MWGKRMRRFVLLVACIGVIFSGCASKKTIEEAKVDIVEETKTLCTTLLDSREESILFTSKDDKVTSYLNTMSIDTSKSKLSTVEEIVDRYVSIAKNVKGVTHEYTIDGDVINQTLFVDFSVADVQELGSAGMILVDRNATHLSLKEYTNQLEKYSDYTCEMQP